LNRQGATEWQVVRFACNLPTMLTDFFVAPKGGLKREALVDGPEGHHPCSSWKDTDQIRLGTLESILVGTDADVAIDATSDARVDDNGEEGPWVVRLRQELVRGLDALKDPDLKAAALCWNRTEEWQADGATDDSVGDLVKQLGAMRQLARQAVAAGLDMYVWVSL
jgi:hypothetical protein